MGWRLRVAKLAVFGRLPFGDALRRAKRNLLGYRPDAGNLRETLVNLQEMTEELAKVGRTFQGATVLEIGSGWFPTIPVALCLNGAKHVFMTDLIRHQDPITFNATLEFLKNEPAFTSRLQNKNDYSDFPLTYLAPFDISTVPDSSIDYIISRTVLEHIPEAYLMVLLAQLKPKLAPGGLMVHLIDHSDHLEHADLSLSKVEFLSWSDQKHQMINWLTKEGENRLRHHEYASIFQTAGYEIIGEKTEVHEPTKKAVSSLRLAPRFKDMSADQISILKSILIARKHP